MLTFKYIISTLCRKYYQPRYWPLLLALMVSKLLVSLLPPMCLLYLGQGLGWVGFHCAKRRRSIALRNIQACFPELNAQTHHNMVYDNFMSFGRGVIETVIAWMMPQKKFDRLVKVKMVGASFFDEAQQLRLHQGVIFLSPHLVCMEIMGRYFAQRSPVDLVYQQHRNPLFEEAICQGRSFIENFIERRETRKMVRSLKAGHQLWYCPDQDFGEKVSVFAPFFGIPCATARGLSWLYKMANPVVYPVSYRRLPGFFEYEVIVEAPLQGIPSGSDLQDAILYNQCLERVVRENVADYFWVHRRFKNRPAGEPPFYS